MAAFIFCGGNAGAAIAPLLVRALFRAKLPPHPPYAWRGRAWDTNVQCVVGKFIGYLRLQKYKCACFSSAMKGMVL